MTKSKLTEQVGRSEKVCTEPGTLPVGNTNKTVAGSRGLEKVALALGDGGNVVTGTNASPTAEHCGPVMLRIPFLIRLQFS